MPSCLSRNSTIWHGTNVGGCHQNVLCHFGFDHPHVHLRHDEWILLAGCSQLEASTSELQLGQPDAKTSCCSARIPLPAGPDRWNCYNDATAALPLHHRHQVCVAIIRDQAPNFQCAHPRRHPLSSDKFTKTQTTFRCTVCSPAQGNQVPTRGPANSRIWSGSSRWLSEWQAETSTSSSMYAALALTIIVPPVEYTASLMTVGVHAAESPS
jgi:hypothetical protein